MEISFRAAASRDATDIVTSWLITSRQALVVEKLPEETHSFFGHAKIFFVHTCRRFRMQRYRLLFYKFQIKYEVHNRSGDKPAGLYRSIPFQPVVEAIDRERCFPAGTHSFSRWNYSVE